MKGQGATEYLVILAVVLIVALVVIALLGFFPGLGGPAREVQSASYWSGARPFSITAFAINNTTVTLRMSNRLSEKVRLINMTFDGSGLNVSNVTFRGGEEKVVSGDMGIECGEPGEGFEFDITMTYNLTNFTEQVQYGDKPLVGRCT